MPKRDEDVQIEYRLTWSAPSGQLSALFQTKRLAWFRWRILAAGLPVMSSMRMESRRVDPWKLDLKRERGVTLTEVASAEA